ncbi:MAG: hypothetical protein J6X44_13690, partial [Thermoguttaceae bacterium]|nr:hypothetical protein [Thermoguttaceae bacterium]
AVDDAQYVETSSMKEPAIDLGSVLNTTADGDGEQTSITITQSDLLDSQTRSSLEELGFRFDFTKNVSGTHITILTISWDPTVPKSYAALRLDSFQSLGTLDVSNLGLAELDVASLSSIRTLKCAHNQLTSLNIGNNKYLYSLNCEGNDIGELDLSGSPGVYQLTLDYDVKTLFIGRSPSGNASGVDISLYDVPGQNSVEAVDSQDNSSIEVETTQYTTPPQYAKFTLPQLGPSVYDPIYVTTTANDVVTKMTINPMFLLDNYSKTVNAVVDNGKLLTQINSFVHNGDAFNYSLTMTDDDPSDYFEIANDSLIYKGGLAPRQSPYKFSITATCGNASETLDYALTVNAPKIDAPEVAVADRGIDTITVSWDSATCTYDHDDNPETPDVAKPVPNVVYYFKVNGEIYTVDGKPYITNDTSFTATELNPDAKYDVDVIASHYLGLSDNIDLTTVQATVEGGVVNLDGYVKDMIDSDSDPITAFTTGSSIVVTLEGEDSDLNNDFDKGGAPNQISLREAYGYINRYYNGTAWSDPVAESDITYDETIGLYTYTISETTNGTTSAKTYAVVKTIKFANSLVNVYVEDDPIVSVKTFTIDGKVGAESIQINGVNPNPTLGENQTLEDYDAAHATRIFEINAGTVTANDVVLTKGYAENGGAIYINGGEYVANGGRFLKNVATKYGGAVYVGVNGKLSADGATFEENESTRGGAIANFGEVAITGTSFFTNNMATPLNANPNNGSFGGAIYNAGTITICVEDFIDPDNPEATAPKTTFNGNRADDDDPIAPDGILK